MHFDRFRSNFRPIPKLTHAWGFREYTLDFPKFLVNVYFTNQSHYGPEFLKKYTKHSLQVNRTSFWWFFYANLVYQISFHVSFKNQNFQKIRYICALNHLSCLSKDFPDCKKKQLWDFLGLRTSMKLEGWLSFYSSKCHFSANITSCWWFFLLDVYSSKLKQ